MALKPWMSPIPAIVSSEGLAEDNKDCARLPLGR
jgi:hypothetical protein